MNIEQEVKQESFENNQHKAYVNLLFTYNWLISIARNVFINSGITNQQYNVLRILKGSHPVLMHAGEIKAVMVITPASANRQATSDILRMFSSLSSGENPRSLFSP